MTYQPIIANPAPPSLQVPQWVIPIKNTAVQDAELGSVMCLDIARAASETTNADLALYNARRPAVAQLQRGIFGVVIGKRIAAGETGKLLIMGRAPVLIASTAAGTTTAAANTGGHVTANAFYLDVVAPSTATGSAAGSAGGRLILATTLESGTGLHDGGTTPTPKLVDCMFDGFRPVRQWEPGVAAFVADATAGSAAEINAIRNALVTAKLMASA